MKWYLRKQFLLQTNVVDMYDSYSHCFPHQQLSIYVVSAAKDVHRRTLIRQTWGDRRISPKLKSMVFFVIGLSNVHVENGKPSFSYVVATVFFKYVEVLLLTKTFTWHQKFFECISVFKK